MLDKSFQDVAVYTSFRCKDSCSVGYLLRAEKTADGWKGIFVSFSPNEPADYRVTIDASGNITSKELLGHAGGQVRIQTPPVPNAAPNHSGGGSDILAADMNKDGKLDIVTSTRFGTFIFWNQILQGKGSAKTAR